MDAPFRLRALIRLLRPTQWSKNVFVLVALSFAAADRTTSLTAEATARTLGAFVAFCLVASAVYVFNDLLDVERDRAHPEKKNRPIASGQISIPSAVALALVCLGTGLVEAGVAGGGLPVVGLLGIYVLVNLAYTLRLKEVVLVDAFCVASGFLLRLAVGGLAAGATVSHWAYLCTFFLALFLALAKRRAEIEVLGAARSEHRPILRAYTPAGLDQMIGMLAACTIVSYTMYTVDPGTATKFGPAHRLVWTVPFVVFGLGRYMVLVRTGKGENPTRVFLAGDAWFLANTLAWLVCVVVALGGLDASS